MTTFLDRLKKPSNAVQAMVDGLRNLDCREDVKINMAVFVRKFPGSPCWVCAATAAALQATSTPVETLMVLATQSDDWDALVLATQSDDRDDLIVFEITMNMFRMGESGEMLKYFGVPVDHPAYGIDCLWYLDTVHWRERLSLVEEYRDKLIELGL